MILAKRILSGTRPTGKLHLGHLLGVLSNWKKYQSEDAFYMIADWHALTTEYEAHVSLKDVTYEVALDYLASGLEPDQCTIFVQSWVKEHAELALLLGMVTPLPWLERCPTYKEKISEESHRNLLTHGFLGYPVLQASDILLYQADVVPVGEDQLPHIELTREIARRFNHLYKKIFKEPESLLTKEAKVPGTDGRKMSKSYDNCLYLSDSPDELRKKLKKMLTDPERKRREDKGHPDVCPVGYYQTLFNEKSRTDEIWAMCRTAAIGCVDCKMELADKLIEFLAPIYEKRQELAKKKDWVIDVLKQGSQKASKIAAETLYRAKEAAGLWALK